MADTIEQVILDVQAVCPDADPNLARLWVRNAGRRTLESNQWSWLLKRSQFVIPASVTNVSSSATVSVTQDLDEITFNSGIATESMVGRQFRTTTSAPIYDIIGYISTTKLRIFPPWGGANASGLGFTIMQSRLPLPDDCVELLSVVSPTNKWQLWLNVPQEVLDGNDPARNRGGGNPCLLSPFDHSSIFSGTVDDAILAIGSGPTPITGGEYVGQADAIYTIQVTTGGIGGVAVFKWKRNSESFNTGVTSDSVVGNTLADGVVVLWPSSSTFIINDVFTIRVYSHRSPGSPRLEMYPFSSSALVLPYLYVSRYPDLTDDGVHIPGALAARTDIILEKALEFAAAWQGTEDRPNTYNQISRRDYHALNWMLQVNALAKQDNGLFQRNVLPSMRLPFAPWPFHGAGNLQEYDPTWMYPLDLPNYPF